jgi:hypothetical protein
MKFFSEKFTLRYEYRLMLYQLLNHRVVELHDQLVKISIVYLIVETINTKNNKRNRRNNYYLLQNKDFGMHMVIDFHW